MKTSNSCVCCNNVKPVLSIIVPIYNCSNYLKKCLYCLQSQTLQDIEIICVDDGSSDNSVTIAKSFESVDSRFKVIEQKNAGCYNARKKGLLHAKGQYCGFVDGDDYVSENYFKKLYEAAVLYDSDIVLTNRIIRVVDKKIDQFLTLGNGNAIDNIITPDDRVNYVINNGMVWNRIYKIDFAREISKKFYYPTFSISEDNFFSIFAGLLAHKITVINNVCYYWRINSNSITEGNKKSVTTGLNVYQEYTKILEIFYSLCDDLANTNKISTQFKKNISDIYENRRFYELSIIKKRASDSLYWVNKKQSLFFYLLFFAITRDRFCLREILNIKIKSYILLLIGAFAQIIKKIKFLSAFYFRLKILWNAFRLWNKNRKLITQGEDNFCRQEIISLINSDNIVVILSSSPNTIKNIYDTLDSLLSQSFQSYRVELWLSEVEFKQSQGNNKLPKRIVDLQSKGLRICWTQCEPFSNCNILNAISKHYEDIVVTANENIVYYKTWLNDLYINFIKNKDKKIIYCHVMNKIKFDNENPITFAELLLNIEDTPSAKNFPINLYGVIYPPRCFYRDIDKFNIFMQLSSNSIDIWLWAMLILNGWEISTVKDRKFNKFKYKFSFFKDQYIHTTEDYYNKFEIDIKKMFEYYPKLREYILN